MSDFSVEDLFGTLSSTNGDSPTAEELFDQIDYDAPPDPEPEKPFEDHTQTIGDGECVVCGAPTFRPPGLTKSGQKKRTPRLCDDHANNKQVSQDRPKSTKVESQLQNVKDALEEDMMLLGTLAGPLLPVTGTYIIQQSDPFTTALINLCKNNKTMLRVLHRAAQVAPVYVVAQTVAGTAYAVQVDLNGADAHGTIGKRLHVDKAADLIMSQEVNQQQQAGGFTTPPPMY